MSANWDMDIVPRTSGVASRPQDVYVVEPDDTLFSISSKQFGHGNNADMIAAANSINPGDALHEGMVLRIPRGVN